MKVNIIIEDGAADLEKEINRQLKKLENDGKEIVDIKFVIREDYIYNFYAMIIYKE